MQRIRRGGEGCCVEPPANPCISRENSHKMTVVVVVVVVVVALGQLPSIINGSNFASKPSNKCGT